MISPGEDIRAARSIYAILYGEEDVWSEVNVMLWMREAQALTKMLGVSSFQEALSQISEIPINLQI